ncbi:hypothetical protein [Enterococcus faecium]
MKALHRRSELAEAREEAAVSDDHFDIETSHQLKKMELRVH